MPVYIPNPDLRYLNSKKKQIQEKEREEIEIYAEHNVGAQDVYEAARERYEESKTGAGYDAE